MAQPEIHDQAAAYALDALDPEERWTYERHLDTCERCRREVATLREIAGELAYAADGPEPSPELRDRILAAATAEPRTATAAVLPIRRRWLFPATAVAAAAAACAAIGLGLWANSLRDGATRQRVVPMEGGGSLVVEDGRATLVACLDAPPAGKTYEAWVIEGRAPRPAALFSGGCRSVPLERPVDEGDTVAVTIEDAGGAQTPHGEILMRPMSEYAVRLSAPVGREEADDRARTDEQVLEAVGRGDHDALAELYDRFGRLAYGLAFRILRDRALAEDAVQEAFLAVWRSADAYKRERAKPSTWILTVVHRRAVDLVRREERRRGEPLESAPVSTTGPADEDVVLRDRRAAVQAALTALPDDQRQALELGYYGGLTQSEVAERLGVPLGTVKSRMFAGLGRLRELLAEP